MDDLRMYIKLLFDSWNRIRIVIRIVIEWKYNRNKNNILLFGYNLKSTWNKNYYVLTFGWNNIE